MSIIIIITIAWKSVISYIQLQLELQLIQLWLQVFKHISKRLNCSYNWILVQTLTTTSKILHFAPSNTIHVLRYKKQYVILKIAFIFIDLNLVEYNHGLEHCFSKWATWLPKKEFIIWREENLLKEESGRNLDKCYKLLKDQAGPDLPLG